MYPATMVPDCVEALHREPFDHSSLRTSMSTPVATADDVASFELIHLSRCQCVRTWMLWIPKNPSTITHCC